MQPFRDLYPRQWTSLDVRQGRPTSSTGSPPTPTVRLRRSGTRPKPRNQDQTRDTPDLRHVLPLNENSCTSTSRITRSTSYDRVGVFLWGLINNNFFLRFSQFHDCHKESKLNKWSLYLRKRDKSPSSYVPSSRFMVHDCLLRYHSGVSSPFLHSHLSLNFLTPSLIWQ